MTEAELYRAAADLLRQNGWCQKRYQHGETHCLVGALDAVDRSRSDNTPKLFSVVGDSRTDFNDARDMTAEDVIAALEIAADLAS